MSKIFKINTDDIRTERVAVVYIRCVYPLTQFTWCGAHQFMAEAMRIAETAAQRASLLDGTGFNLEHQEGRQRSLGHQLR